MFELYIPILYENNTCKHKVGEGRSHMAGAILCSFWVPRISWISHRSEVGFALLYTSFLVCYFFPCCPCTNQRFSSFSINPSRPNFSAILFLEGEYDETEGEAGEMVQAPRPSPNESGTTKVQPIPKYTSFFIFTHTNR